MFSEGHFSNLGDVENVIASLDGGNS